MPAQNVGLSALMLRYRRVLGRSDRDVYANHPQRSNFLGILEQGDAPVQESMAALAAAELDWVELMKELQEIEQVLDKWRGHYAAREAKAAYLMDLMDQVHGRDASPARAEVPDPPKKVDGVPYDPRKGQPVTTAKLVYLNELEKNFHRRFHGSPLWTLGRVP